MYDEEVLTALRGWTQKIVSTLAPDARLLQVHVFGSLVNIQGRGFSKKQSDLDLLVTLDSDDPAHRLQFLDRLAPDIHQLEDLLRKLMGRTDREPLVSATVATKFEIDQGIHKDRNSKIFFASRSFLPLISVTEELVQVGNALEADLLTEFFIGWTVLAKAQSKRNWYVKREARDYEFDGPLPLPKDLLRSAYATERLTEGEREAFGEVDDMAKGLQFLKKELEERYTRADEANALLNMLESTRPGGRGERRPVPARLVQYAWELLATCAQTAIMLQRAKRATTKNHFAARTVREELERYQATNLVAIDTAIELYRGDDLVVGSDIPVAIEGKYRRDLHEMEAYDPTQRAMLIAEWHDLVQELLQTKLEDKASPRSECKVGFTRLDYSHRGIGDRPTLAIRPLTYWVIRHFNKEIAANMNQSQRHLRIRREFLERLLVAAEDFKMECPSALYVELAIITSDGRVPVFIKSVKHSVLSRQARNELFTCGPEYGLVWQRHVTEGPNGPSLKVGNAILEGLYDEFGIEASDVDDWKLVSLALQSVHLNTALAGVVRVRLSQAELTARLTDKRHKDLKYHNELQTFLSASQIYDTIQADFGQSRWHTTGLLRLSLAANMMGVSYVAHVS
jgi:predicted nucleotidyltransferase